MLTLDINGRITSLDVPAQMPLLWALRDVADLTGTKYGCGGAQCGACTVHADGHPIPSCVTPAGAVHGQRIVTIEGVGADRVGQAVQHAWRELDVAQCGFCQSGQIMSAVALLRRHPRPTDAQIDQAMRGNLCRCATYERIRAAIHHAAAALD
ncbi:isoquinoline 1-oxidoreductase subunit alpha [Bordetella ansorpii]|uniref:Isoquinoline 1-oxidoreductase subunit alpha n=1 Tax=Bordetella ansorpii TaxID=288768 RepID=A0A157SMZ8_9BORD|nr:(2Fe-2S)-binding protein [Bordetella ansorpii]SAI71543.1 isoquinoline 1-oxidoreductase subunit alpha [Bordetella ansorpii]